MSITDVLADHPARPTFDTAELARAIEACRSCATLCNLCADSDLARSATDMLDCVRTCLDCATICDATASVLSRPTPSGDAWAALLKACIVACEECAAECGSHDHVCCRSCADACRTCVDALRALAAVANVDV